MACSKEKVLLVSVAVAVAMVIMVSPFFYSKKCHIPEWDDREEDFVADVSPQDLVLGKHFDTDLPALRFGSQFMFGALAPSLVAIWVGSRERRKDPATAAITRRARPYIIVTFIQCIFESVGGPWAFAICSSATRPLYSFSTSGVWLVYIIGQVFLARITLLRLRLVAGQAATIRARRVGISFLVVAFISTVTTAAFEVPQLFYVFTFLACFTLYGGFQAIATYYFWIALRFAKAEVKDKGADRKILESATLTFYSMVFSSVTTVFAELCRWNAMMLNEDSDVIEVWRWIEQFALCLDVPFDVLFALTCSGWIGPKADYVASLQQVGSLVEERRQRFILEKLKNAARALVGPAATLASLFEGVDVDVLLQSSMKKFRAISWEVLSQHPELLIGAGTLDGNKASADLYDLSEPCQLAGCDAFWSHSWHDDGKEKMEALKIWSEDFKEKNGRYPRIWFDKVCINQNNIEDDLQCLPIFLAGCNLLLISSGTTYTQRLWCCVELFVHITMAVEDENYHKPVVHILGRTKEAKLSVVRAWQSFDFRNCQCFKLEDKERILSIIDRHRGGADEFNGFIRGLAEELFAEYIENGDNTI